MIPPSDVIDSIISLVKVGKEIYERCDTYFHASEDLKKLGDRLKASIFVLEVFQRIMPRVLNSLLPAQQRDIGRLIDHLQGVFDKLDQQLSRFPQQNEKFDVVRKLRWTFGGKSGFEAILQEMAQWRDELDAVVNAAKLLQTYEDEEDRKVYEQLFQLGETGLRSASTMDDIIHGRRETNAHSLAVDAAIVTSTESRSAPEFEDGDRKILPSHTVFIECRYPESRSSQELDEAKVDILKLASVLHEVDMDSMHILRCKGMVFQQHFDNRTLLVYDIPSIPTRDMKWTLKNAIAKDRKPSLDVRVQYGVEISMAVMFTHAAGLVHKSICPDNVLLLKPAQPSAVAHELSAFLVGFEAARLRDLSAYSDQLPEADAIGKLYSHPERVIPHENGHVVRFGMRHDMYSLGIVLLELGMWKPIEAIGGDLSKADQAEFNARKLRKRLIDVAEKHLAATAGPKYSDAVLCCLRDATEKGLDDERGMREKFYYRVLQQLKQIVV